MYFDSFYSSGSNITSQILNFIEFVHQRTEIVFYRNKWTALYSTDFPAQPPGDTSSCGILVCLLMESLALQKPRNYSVTRINEWRKMMKYILI